MLGVGQADCWETCVLVLVVSWEAVCVVDVVMDTVPSKLKDLLRWLLALKFPFN